MSSSRVKQLCHIDYVGLLCISRIGSDCHYFFLNTFVAVISLTYFVLHGLDQNVEHSLLQRSYMSQ